MAGKCGKRDDAPRPWSCAGAAGASFVAAIGARNAVSCATRNASEPYRRQRVAMRESSGFGSLSTSGGGDTTGDRLALRSAAIFLLRCRLGAAARTLSTTDAPVRSPQPADGSTQAMSGELLGGACEERDSSWRLQRWKTSSHAMR